MKRYVLLFLLFALSSCVWGASNHMLSQITIRASPTLQLEVIEAIKRFGKENGFKVDARSDLPRDGRRVSQVSLIREDGIIIVTDNFMREDVLDTGFYSEKKGSDWRAARDKWLGAIRPVVGNQGDIAEKDF